MNTQNPLPRQRNTGGFQLLMNKIRSVLYLYKMRREINISLVLRHGKAYMPTLALSTSGILIDSEPVLDCELVPEEVIENIELTIKSGHPIIKMKSREEFKAHSKLMLKAAGVRSWKELARDGIAYSISKNKKQISIHMTRLDKQGRWEFDPEKKVIFPAYTPWNKVLQPILDDYYSQSQSCTTEAHCHGKILK